ncbi:SPOR domain-containing protein [Rhizobium helianthi]|uniref:SPOR domain-containing protein n=1 Tax=Rhizobium helianthi TaxID=1132695 RepID=A0ABW4M154_9HYPH
MANNNVAYGRNGAPDFFADDDPLAELARIVGYDDRPQAQPAADASLRREPAFNLEDELLRELQGFDAPRNEPHGAGDPVVADVVEPVVPPPASNLNAQASDPFAEPDPFVEPELPGWNGGTPVVQYGAVPARPLSDIPVRDIPVSDAQVGEMRSAPNVVSASADVRKAAPVSSAYDSASLSSDLISELETSLAPAAPVAKPSSRPPARAYEPGFRMPLANFNPASVPRHEPRPVQPAQPADVTPVVTPVPEAVAPEASPVSASSEASIWEAELARVAAFAVAPAAAQPQPSAPRDFVPRAVEPARAEPDFGFAPQMPAPSQPAVQARQPEPSVALSDDDFDLALDDLDLDFSDLMDEQPVAAEPVKAERQEPRLEAQPDRLQSQPRPVAPMPIAPMPVGQPAAPVQRPVQSEPTVAAVPSFLMNSRSAAAVSQPASFSAAASQAAPTTPVAQFQPAATQMRAEPSQADADGFDPALFADADEMPETVPDLNVPELPSHEPEQRPVAHPEFDIDLDSELASFLDSANIAPRAQEASRPRNAAPAAASMQTKPEQTAAAPLNDGLDDFERALEEDFRRSLATPFPGPTALDDEDPGEDYAAPRRVLPSWVVPASVAGVVAIAGLSAFAWYTSGGSSVAGDGAPVVIAADTDPVKVVPENPGGKVVPNQNKAVYDRVASGGLDAPKQQSLITSDEQPVDVVQKTLVPETLPLEGENDEMDAGGTAVGGTAVGDTQDARLLPQETAAASSGSDQLAVMPRKVKTMIVRPDGTLVEQVVDAPAAAPAANAGKVPAAPALAEPTRTAAAPAGNAPVAAETTGLSDVNIAKTTTLTGTSTVAPAANTPAAAPAQAAATQKPSAPVPSARPAEQPVQVVAAVSSQGNVRQPAAQTPAAAPAAASATSGAGGYFIQVASLPSEADAQKSYKNLSSKFGNVIGGRGVDIAKAEIAGKGTFYRVRIPAGNSKDEAAALCERLRAAGGTCLIAR